ncbi:MAG: DUF2303 family protein, partial [Cyanobacteria bacterium REEB65]|nr:DUF2303 family protein [Cyanobacteria bacterium REEB65]
TVADIESFASYLSRWGKPDRTIVYCHGGEVVAILDEEENDDKIVLAMEKTRQHKLWLAILANPKVSMGHKAFKEFLEEHYHEIEDGEALYTAISNLSLATTFKYDGRLDNERCYSIAFEADDGASVTKLPKHINVTIPLWEGLLDPDLNPGPDGLPTGNRIYTFPAKLLFKVPSEGQKEPSFGLYCETSEEVLDQAERDIAIQVHAKLKDWQVLNGQPGKTR